MRGLGYPSVSADSSALTSRWQVTSWRGRRPGRMKNFISNDAIFTA